MTAQTPNTFRDCIILGDALTARLAALALSPQLPIRTMVGPQLGSTPKADPENLSGKAAHSHIFMPRFGQELERAAPGLWNKLATAGLAYRPGSTRLNSPVEPGATRLFATRWQLDEAIDQVFRDEVSCDYSFQKISDFTLKKQGGQQVLNSLQLGDDSILEIADNTLVIDAMGATSPLCAAFKSNHPDHIDHVGHVSYVTQFFKLNTPSEESTLPDPLTKSAQSFGESHVMLYPGQNGWFSISVAVGNDNKKLLIGLRDQKAFFEYCAKAPDVLAWIQAATPVGEPKSFLKPRNRWNVSGFSSGVMPANYIALGDALATTLPTLGAGCSFAAMHIRVLAETLPLGAGAFHGPFAKTIRAEQFPFFLQSMAPDLPEQGFKLSKPSAAKQLRNRLRRIFGLDRIRIRRDLVRTSSLSHKT